jgi:hypothetical protein
MTSKEFVIWLKGFTEGVHDFNITPKQWDLLKEELAKVSDQTYTFGTPNGTTSSMTYSTNGGPNWYTTTIANEKTLLND